MGHHIRGYLVKNQDVNKLPPSKLIPLKADITFVPKLHWSIEEEYATLQIPLALISTDYFGGFGEQSAILWDGNKIVFEETEIGGPINKALKALGVQKVEPYDEFDTVGLGKYRLQDDFDEDLEWEE